MKRLVARRIYPEITLEVNEMDKVSALVRELSA
jgi:hypothetical protein